MSVAVGLFHFAFRGLGADSQDHIGGVQVHALAWRGLALLAGVVGGLFDVLQVRLAEPETPGDVQQNGAVTTGDIIYLVNFVFKLGPDPLPCIGAADLDCSGNISSADIIYLVNKVLKAGPDPCDMCTLIPSVWTCP